MKYYIKKNDLGQLEAIPEREGTPVNIDDFAIVDLPDNDGGLLVRSKKKVFPDFKVAMAVFAGQINIDDIVAA